MSRKRDAMRAWLPRYNGNAKSNMSSTSCHQRLTARDWCCPNREMPKLRPPNRESAPMTSSLPKSRQLCSRIVCCTAASTLFQPMGQSHVDTLSTPSTWTKPVSYSYCPCIASVADVLFKIQLGLQSPNLAGTAPRLLQEGPCSQRSGS